MKTELSEEFQGTDRFTLIRTIGSGGMGVVYEAYDKERDMKVALKTLRNMNVDAVFAFKSEFRSLTQVVHPNLLPLYELISHGTHWFFTMELIDDAAEFLPYVRGHVSRTGSRGSDDTMGEQTLVRNTKLKGLSWGNPPQQVESLRAGTGERQDAFADDGTNADSSLNAMSTDGAMERTVELNAQDANELTRAAPSARGLRPRKKAPGINFDRLRDALSQIAEGLQVLHSHGIIHRDLKPDNTLIHRRDGRAVLLDFGLAVAQQDVPDGRIAGTVGYMSPEQASGSQLTPATDWYSFGVILFRALTDRKPFQGESREVLAAKKHREAPAPGDLYAGIPADLNALCIDLLKRRPEDRPTGSEIVARLRGKESVGSSNAVDLLSLPFVGRNAHLEKLVSEYQRVMAGDSVVCCVHGRSGAGKSTLIDRFLDRVVEQDGAVVLRGRCYEQESVPYKGVDSLVDALTRFLLQLSKDEQRAYLPRHAAALGRVFPMLNRIESVADAPKQQWDAPDLQELRRQAFLGLRELVARIADRYPMVLFIDDLQWGDVDSAALLCELLEPPDAPRVLMLLSYRSEYVQTSACLKALEAAESEDEGRSHEELVVEALGSDEALELAGKLLGDHSAGRATQIAEASRGSPLFVYELVRHVQAGLDLPEEDAGTLDLDEVLWKRVERLPSHARQLLEVVAVAGKPVSVGVALEAAQLGTLSPQVSVALRTDHLVRSTGPTLHDEIETYHDRIRESIVAHLSKETRTLHHAGLASALEESGSADPETLAVHLLGAEQHRKAGYYFSEAARLASDALAFDRAATLYQRSLELSPPEGEQRVEMHTEFGDALANAGRCAEAGSQFLIAAQGAERQEKIELERRAAYQYLAGGHLDEGRKVLRGVLGKVSLTLPNRQVGALTTLLYHRFRLWTGGLEFTACDVNEIPQETLSKIDVTWSVAAGLGTKNIIIGPAYQSLNLRLALKAGDPFRIARALAWEAAQVSNDGASAWDRTTTLLDRAKAVAAPLDEPYLDGLISLADGIRQFTNGRWKPGSELLGQAELIFRQKCTGAAWELGQANTFALWCVSYMGELKDVQERSERLIRAAKDKGDLFSVANLGTFMLPLAKLAEDNADEARNVLSESMRQWSEEEYNIQHMTALMGATYVDLYRGKPQEAYDRHVDQWSRLRWNNIFHAQICRLLVSELRARSALGVAVQSGGSDSLLREAETRARRIERENTPYANALAKLLHAGVAATRGDKTLAGECLADAAQALDEVHMGLFAAVARRRLGELRGGEEGKRLVDGANAWMGHRQIRDPTKMAQAIAPWMP